MGKVYCVTMNTKASVYLDIWLRTARYFDYHPIVVGMNTPWRGWLHRTRVYHAAIKDLEMEDSDVVIICDSNDLFFAGSATECMEKFLKMKIGVVIGSETACCTGDLKRGHRRQKAVEILKDDKNNYSAYRSPNGGCLMGYKNPIMDLLRINSDQLDDQAGYLKLFLTNNSRFDIDDRQSIFGNIHILDMPFESFYAFHQNRYRNRVTGEYPCVLHFPGKNFDSYHRMIYTLNFPFLYNQKSALYLSDVVWSVRYCLMVSAVVIIIIVIIHILTVSKIP